MPQDFVRLVDSKLVVYGRTFVISPKQLRKFTTRAVLTWGKVKFTPSNRASIPTDRGIYAFVAEHNENQLPPHGYVMYVGISGDKSSHNLRRRYGDYLREKRIKKRAGIHYMLNKWGTCLYFHFAVVNDRRISLLNLEKAMSDALVPPFSQNDFSAEIREARRAFK